MPFDFDPIDALDKHLQMEDLSSSPVTKFLVQAFSLLPLPSPFDKIADGLKDNVEAGELERIRLMVETCMSEIRKHEGQLAQLTAAETAEEIEKRSQALIDLSIDAARKAERTRAKERVRRIGLILANAAVESQRMDEDEIEEMMRIAMDLSDRDVELLKELIKIEGYMLQTQKYIPRHDAYNAWTRGFWGEQINPEIDSVFSKLESYGLVSRIAPPNNFNISADLQNRYVLLRKGIRFVGLVQSHSD